MLRLRHAIERASRHRWLGLLVVLCLALLLLLLVLHTLEEHGGLEQSALTCVVVMIVAALRLLFASPAIGQRLHAAPRRGPPQLVVSWEPLRGGHAPGSTPLRL